MVLRADALLPASQGRECLQQQLQKVTGPRDTVVCPWHGQVLLRSIETHKDALCFLMTASLLPCCCCLPDRWLSVRQELDTTLQVLGIGDGAGHVANLGNLRLTTSPHIPVADAEAGTSGGFASPRRTDAGLSAAVSSSQLRYPSSPAN